MNPQTYQSENLRYYICTLYFLNTTQKWYYNIYPTRCNVAQFILSENCSTCFGWYIHPSLRAHKSLSTASGICYTVTATCYLLPAASDR